MIIIPECTGSYTCKCEEKEKFLKQVLAILKRKRLPKSLEISWTRDLLEVVKNRPEHEYSRKYDTFHSQHPLFF